MRITILALGSQGDVQPLVPLGQALQSAGHRVRLATFEAFAPMVTGGGLEFFRLQGDAHALLNAAGQGLLDSQQNLPQTIRALQRSYFTLIDGWAQDLSDPALRDTQLLLNQLPGNAYGYDLAEHLGVPQAMVAVIPLVRTRAWPMMAFPAAFSWLPGYNSFTYRLAEQILWQMFRPAINRWRVRTLGLPALSIPGPFAEMFRHVPVINGFSEHVVPRPPDWGNHVHITGWWFPEDAQWEPPSELLRFLEDGTPPVFIGFGSMPVSDPARLTALLVEAVRLSGGRAILHAGWAGLGHSSLPPEIFPMTYAPYAWLFPRMAAVVHHGGSGTSGLGFRSGVPSIIVPFGFDQFYWGKRAVELGVGPQPIPLRKLTAARLAAAIQTAVTDQAMQRCAAELGRKLNAEQGVQRAVEIVERLAS